MSSCDSFFVLHLVYTSTLVAWSWYQLFLAVGLIKSEVALSVYPDRASLQVHLRLILLLPPLLMYVCMCVCLCGEYMQVNSHPIRRRLRRYERFLLA